MRVPHVMLMLVGWSVGACRGGSSPAPAASEGSGTAVAPAIRPASPIDAATGDAQPIDAAGIDAAVKITVGNRVPPLGCLGWSPARGLAACIVGHTGYNVGPVEAALVFVALSEAAAAPPPLALATYDEESAYRLAEDLPPAIARQLAAALADVVPWTASGRVETSYVDNKLVTSPSIEVAGLTIGARIRPGPGGSMTQLYRADLTVRAPNGRRLLDEAIDHISSFSVTAFTVPGPAAPRTVLLEVIHGIGDEGTSGTTSSVYRCTATTCTATPQ